MKTYLRFEKISHCLIEVHYANGPAFLELIIDVSGYWYASIPLLNSKSGLLPAYVLRELADYLDAINKPWSDEINKYFDEHPTENA